MSEQSEVYLAARLIQWGLRPRERPAQEKEYMALVDRYLDQPAFRAAVEDMARGLGLAILDIGEYGVALAPVDPSAFAYRPQDFRVGKTVEERLIDGLVQIAIAATVFPRSRDLEEDAALARQPVTIDEIDETLRTICSRLEEAARRTDDPLADEDLAGLEEAWRVYQRRLSSIATASGQQSARATRRVIEYGLDRLTEFGCFLRVEHQGGVHYQPTWRYQVQVKELAASKVYAAVRKRLEEVDADQGGAAES